MKTIQTHARYIEWLSADEMHNDSQDWLSELKFMSDEHLFFEDLVTSYTLQLIEGKKFAESKALIEAINKSQKRNKLLIEAVQTHENDLQIMVDGVNELKKEDAYTKEHLQLITIINDFLSDYKTLKLKLFNTIKTIKKEEKQKHLIDKK